MSTIKSFSDLQQSKKLAEILPLESADMYWDYDENTQSLSEAMAIPIYEGSWKLHHKNWSKDIPCWSLAALRNLLPPAIKLNKNTYLFESHNTFDNSWVYRYYNEDGVSYLYCKDTNEVDACVEMIIKLNELKML